MYRRLCWLLVGICTALITLRGEPAPLVWPAIHQETKPWTRWWWLGNIADEKSITSEMEKYAAAGLGGLEITPIYGVRGYEDRFVPFLSPTWVRNFEYVLAEGRRLGLGIDLATGTGWPFGGPWLGDTDVAHYLAHKIYTLPSGARPSEPVAFVQPGLIRYAGPRHEPLSAVKRPVTANSNLQDLAIDQVRFECPLPLVSLMAFPEHGEPLDLTAKVGNDGRLDWIAPADRGTWTLYALFQGQHGKMVERAAPGAEGFALDHFSSTALQHYLAKFDDAFDRRNTGGLRAFFNDSYEVDDSRGEADFTPEFLTEFQHRRGYDLRKHLPEFFASPANETSARILSDYRETVSDLLRDEFTIPWKKWAARHGALIRNQSHGSPANLLDLYAASDIPEQEGSDLLAIKLASSAAHVTGKPLASAETGTWLNEHFLSTLAELKSTVDTFLLSGINHNCYHGTAFSPLDDPWPGFQFYASVELNPRNPFWSDFALVNGYATRAQSILQSGHPDEDVLLYYNIHDRWATRGDGTLPHFNGAEHDGVGARAVAAALHSAGCGFDYVSDLLLTNVQFNGHDLESSGAKYRAIVVPPTKFMPEATLAHLIDLAAGGATILVLDHLPDDAPGLHVRASKFPVLLAKLQVKASIDHGVTQATVGRGQFLIGPDLSALLARCPGIAREPMVDLGLEFVRRRSNHGHFYFIANRTQKPVDTWVPLHATGKSAARYDAMTGAIGRATFRAKADGFSEIYLQLAPGESTIVQVFDTVLPENPRWNDWQPAGGARPLVGEWSIHFVSGGPTLPAPRKISALTSWTNFGGEDVKAFSGTATYTLTFSRPPGDAAAWRLDLGDVANSARIKLNGREIAGLISAPWAVVIPASELREQNELEVSVTNLAANRIADLDRRDPSWKKFYNVNMPARRAENTGPDKLFSAAHWSPRNSGLLGPVMLTPLALQRPEDVK